MSKVVVLLSGGLDSTTVLARAVSAGHEVDALSVYYGQRHHRELFAARHVAEAWGVAHTVVNVDLHQWGGSALTDFDVPVPTEAADGIPVTYVPARNTVLLALAMSYAEAIGATEIHIGVSSVDYSGYPDCRPEYIEAFNAMATLATKNPVRIVAPLVTMSKADTIRLGRSLGVDYTMTHSCYQPTATGPCGQCDSCRIRDAAFAEVGP